jgi:hypothetical protein
VAVAAGRSGGKKGQQWELRRVDRTRISNHLVAVFLSKLFGPARRSR